MLDTESGKAGTESRKFRLDAALDNAPFSALTFWVVCAVAAAVVLEAVNNNLLGLGFPKWLPIGIGRARILNML